VKTETRGEQLYAPGSYAIKIDQFDPKVQRVNVVLTRVAWPGANEETVARLHVAWDDKTGLVIGLPGGVVLDKLGEPELTYRCSVGVPREFDSGRGVRDRAVASADVTLEVLRSLTTAISVEGVS